MQRPFQSKSYKFFDGLEAPLTKIPLRKSSGKCKRWIISALHRNSHNVKKYIYKILPKTLWVRLSMLKMLSGSGCSCCCHADTGAAGFSCTVLAGGVGRTVDMKGDLCTGCAHK